MPALNLLEVPKAARKGRYPKHTFQVRELPFTAVPFCIARVLPGETMKSLHWESRVISDPIRNPIIGWKKQYFFYYVKITDLVLTAAKEMFVDATNAEIAGLDEAGNRQVDYTAKGAINWTRKCMEKIVNHYFRDEGEVAGDRVTADGDFIVPIRDTMFLDSLTDKDLMPEGDAIAGAIDMGDLERLMDAFQQLRALGLSDMSYEDWLRSNGINVPERDEGKPETIDSFQQFQYPSNTIDPADGSPSSAVSWVFNQTTRDPKRFTEPGFVIGVSVTRPKVYFSGLAGSAAGFAQRATDWMPNYLRDLPETSLKLFAAGTGPLGDRTTDTDQYWLDMRDELLYGDQYQNVLAFNAVPANDGDRNMLALPGADLNFRYPTEDMCKSFFVGSGTGIHFIKQDGYCSFNIAGYEADATPSSFNLRV